MTVFKAALLGLVQGLTEFLPVSSSGHLVIAENLLGVKTQGILFEVSLHLATAGAVVLAYRHRIRLILKAIRATLFPGNHSGATEENRENFRLGLYIILGTIPAGVIGVGFKDWFENAFSEPRLVCAMLIATGFILMSARFARGLAASPLGWRNALGVGLAQAVAIIPGISRSGTTITAGLLLGLNPGRAAEFSFLLALPAILGAGLIEGLDLFHTPGLLAAMGAIPLAVGVVTAFFSGYAAIYFLLRVLQRGRFDRFAWYVWAVGLTSLLIFWTP